MSTVHWFFKKIWISEWNTTIPVSCMQNSISIKTKIGSYVKKDMEWVCLGQAKSESVSRTGGSECGMGSYATCKSAGRKEIHCTTTRRLHCRHHLLWTNVGCLCIQSTTPETKHLVDWCGTRSYGDVPLWTEDTWGAWLDIPSSRCWRKTRYAQGIWGNTDTSMPVPPNAHRDEVPHEKTWNTCWQNTPCNHVATDHTHRKRI